MHIKGFFTHRNQKMIYNMQMVIFLHFNTFGNCYLLRHFWITFYHLICTRKSKVLAESCDLCCLCITSLRNIGNYHSDVL